MKMFPFFLSSRLNHSSEKWEKISFFLSAFLLIVRKAKHPDGRWNAVHKCNGRYFNEHRIYQ